MKKMLVYELLQKKMVKCSLIVNAEFLKTNEKNEITEQVEVRIRTPASKLSNSLEIDQFRRESAEYINSRIDDFINNGSNWQLDEIIYSDLELGSCNSLNGSCGADVAITYQSELRKLGITSQYSTDALCFLRSVAYHFIKTKNPKQLNRFIKKHLNTGNLNFPLAIEDIPKFEQMNQHLKIKINILSTEDNLQFYPIYCGKSNAKNIINILLFQVYTDKKEDTVTHHYSYIINLSTLLRKTYKTNRICYQKIVFCGNCLASFATPHKLEDHIGECYTKSTQSITMPFPGNFDKVQFQNYEKTTKVNLVGYYDFEVVLQPNTDPCSRCVKEKSNPSACPHSSVKETDHVPVAYSYIIENYAGQIVKQNTYVGEDCVEKFIDELLDMEHDLIDAMCMNKKMIFTKADKITSQEETFCHICENKLVKKGEEIDDGERTCRDHCHLSGKYLGLAHKSCNFQRTESRYVPMFAHNNSRYDMHILLSRLKPRHMERIGDQIKALPLNNEVFKTLTIKSYTFLDSLSSSTFG